jgi:hypothetical protein
MPDAAATDLDQLEALLGVRLPSDYRCYLLGQDGTDGFYGVEYLVLWPIRDVMAKNISYEYLREDAGGVVLIGSNGAGEAVALDLRNDASVVVLLPFISEGWEDARRQADSFTEFVAQRERGDGFTFGVDSA